MSELAANGLGILMISSDLPEILGMSDRIAVMHAGTIVGEFDRAEATQERVLEMALGHLRKGSDSTSFPRQPNSAEVFDERGVIGGSRGPA